MLANSSVMSSVIADPSKSYLLEHCISRWLTGTDTIEVLGLRHLKSVTLSTCTLKRPSTSLPVTWEATRATASSKNPHYWPCEAPTDSLAIYGLTLSCSADFDKFGNVFSTKSYLFLLCLSPFCQMLV